MQTAGGDMLPAVLFFARVQASLGAYVPPKAHRSAVRVFGISLLAIHGTFLDTKRNLAKNLTTSRQARGGTRSYV
jgi:hypothetical protein